MHLSAIGQRPTAGLAPAMGGGNALVTILWHTGHMPDEDPLFLRPVDRSPPSNRSTTEDGLEFLMEQIARLPTRRELARAAFVILFVGAVLGIVGIEAFWRYVPACG